MLRATIWTVGLFGAGTAICRAFPATWTEPLVLFALGLALLYVSTRAARAPRAEAPARAAGSAGQVASAAPKASPAASPIVAAAAAAAASVQVERTA
jgi:hypothetical protein